MSFFCRELNQTFTTKDEMFFALKGAREEIVKVKKAVEKRSDPVQLFVVKETVKAEGSVPRLGDDFYAIINSTNYFDSHGDVHLDGIWDVSAKDQQGKVYYVINHDLEIGKIISYPNEVEISLPKVNWSDIGLPYEGTTQLLMYKFELTAKSNKDAVSAILDKQPLQNSVRMMYVDMVLCVDSKTEGLEAEYVNFYTYLPKIANKEEAIKAGYYWAVKQAKIWKEGSAVLFGSNDATPILYSDPQNKQSHKTTLAPASKQHYGNKLNFYTLNHI